MAQDIKELEIEWNLSTSPTKNFLVGNRQGHGWTWEWFGDERRAHNENHSKKMSHAKEEWGRARNQLNISIITFIVISHSQCTSHLNTTKLSLFHTHTAMWESLLVLKKLQGIIITMNHIVWKMYILQWCAMLVHNVISVTCTLSTQLKQKQNHQVGRSAH